MTTAAQAASLEAATQARIDSALAEQANDNAAAAAAALALAATEKAEDIAACHRTGYLRRKRSNSSRGSCRRR